MTEWLRWSWRTNLQSDDSVGAGGMACPPGHVIWEGCGQRAGEATIGGTIASAFNMASNIAKFIPLREILEESGEFQKVDKFGLPAAMRYLELLKENFGYYIPLSNGLLRCYAYISSGLCALVD